jgi:hypothetical protein
MPEHGGLEPGAQRGALEGSGVYGHRFAEAERLIDVLLYRYEGMYMRFAAKVEYCTRSLQPEDLDLSHSRGEGLDHRRTGPRGFGKI